MNSKTSTNGEAIASNTAARVGKVIRSSNISILSPGDRFLHTMEELADAVERIRETGLKIVLTMGTFDMMHIGHARYLKSAREVGDILFVGLDDDKKTSNRKGPHRPVVPEEERREMMAHCRYADLIYVKRYDEERWATIKTVHPDILIAVEGTYTDEEKDQLEAEFCGEVKVLPRQAETSTSAKVRRLMTGGLEGFKGKLEPKLANAVQEALRETLEEGI